MWLEFIILGIIASILFYRWATKNNDFFKKRNIPYDKPTFLLGSSPDVTLRRKTIMEGAWDIYNKSDDIAYGLFEIRNPILLIRDPQLIKSIMIRDFDHFVNRRSFVDLGDDNLIMNSLFFMQNDVWRDMRSTLSPAFTGSKMRHMFQLMLDVVHEAMKHLAELRNASNVEEGFELDVKDFSSRLTNDIIASTAFGLQINSYRDKDNEFLLKAKKTLAFSAWQQAKVLFIVCFPKVAQYFKVDMFDKDFVEYFKRLVLDAMEYRKQHNIHRPDMINLLMEARGMIPSDTHKTHYRSWSDTEIVAQCIVFFFAGFESTSAILSFAAHELMEYPAVQDKLFEEIQQFDEQLDGKSITYELLQKMPYMDMVVSEVLRKWPIALATERLCTKDYVYESAETGERLEIKKGDAVRVLMAALHRDPKYFENPDILNPERFSEENKGQIVGGTYLPFGVGPRNCIGNRFALLEMKAFLYYIVRDYRLEASPKTSIPLELSKSNVQVIPKNGFWLQFKSRKLLLNV